MDTLDTQVAQIVHRVALIERLVHDRGPWYIEGNGTKIEAARMQEGDTLVVVATMPEHTFHGIEDEVVPVSLMCGDDLLAVYMIRHPGADTDFTLRFRYAVEIETAHI